MGEGLLCRESAGLWGIDVEDGVDDPGPLEGLVIIIVIVGVVTDDWENEPGEVWFAPYIEAGE